MRGADDWYSFWDLSTRVHHHEREAVVRQCEQFPRRFLREYQDGAVSLASGKPIAQRHLPFIGMPGGAEHHAQIVLVQCLRRAGKDFGKVPGVDQGQHDANETDR